jgi:hypothetical protein
MRQVLLMPEAMPVRAGSTTRKAAPAMVGLARPMPIPETMKPGNKMVQLEVHGYEPHERNPERDDGQATSEQRPHRRLRRVPPRHERHQENKRRHRQETEAGRKRRVAVDVLKIDRQEREKGEHPGAEAERRRLHADKGRPLEEGDVEHGPLLHPFDHHECGEQRGPADERGEDLHAPPPHIVPPQEAEDDEEERG